MLPIDDRDSYINKRIDTCGVLINNLFRNYFNKLVKDMQKQISREINNGSWRSTSDYENIINLTNGINNNYVPVSLKDAKENKGRGPEEKQFTTSNNGIS